MWICNVCGEYKDGFPAERTPGDHTQDICEKCIEEEDLRAEGETRMLEEQVFPD